MSSVVPTFAFRLALLLLLCQLYDEIKIGWLRFTVDLIENAVLCRNIRKHSERTYISLGVYVKEQSRKHTFCLAAPTLELILTIFSHPMPSFLSFIYLFSSLSSSFVYSSLFFATSSWFHCNLSLFVSILICLFVFISKRVNYCHQGYTNDIYVLSLFILKSVTWRIFICGLFVSSFKCIRTYRHPYIFRNRNFLTCWTQITSTLNWNKFKKIIWKTES